MKIRVLIADDHPLIIEGLTTALGRYDIDVVASAQSTAEVLPAYKRCEPEVVVLDVRFGETATGLDVLRSLLAAHRDARVVIYSQFDQDEIVSDAYRSGAKAFVTKAKPPSVVADAVRQVSEGKTWFLPEIAERLALLGLKGNDSPKFKLDPRELEVFRLIALGKTNVEVSQLMGLSPKTISTTSQSIKEKLGIHRSADMARLALKHNLIDP
jgi:two-component system invasion response regulator UvrY